MVGLHENYRELEKEKDELISKDTLSQEIAKLLKQRDLLEIECEDLDKKFSKIERK